MNNYTGSVPDVLDRQDAWKDRGACRYEDPEMFFGPGAQVMAARRICTGPCPVRLECLTANLNAELGQGVNYRWGVYGGLTSTERHYVDPSVGRLENDKALADRNAPHGTYERLLHHLVAGQPIDVACWIAEVRRTLAGSEAARGLPDFEPAAAVTALGTPARAAGAPWAGPDAPPAAAHRSPAGVAAAVPSVLDGLVWQPGQPVAATAPARKQRPPARDAFAGPSRPPLPECGTQEAYDRHLERGEVIDPKCWNAIARHAKKLKARAT